MHRMSRMLRAVDRRYKAKRLSVASLWLLAACGVHLFYWSLVSAVVLGLFIVNLIYESLRG